MSNMKFCVKCNNRLVNEELMLPTGCAGERYCRTCHPYNYLVPKLREVKEYVRCCVCGSYEHPDLSYRHEIGNKPPQYFCRVCCFLKPLTTDTKCDKCGSLMMVRQIWHTHTKEEGKKTLCRNCLFSQTEPKFEPMPTKDHDPVNHPSHYTSHPSGVECITITQHMSFCVGNVVKYLWRAGKKGPALEDLRKAAFYLDKEIKRLESQEPAKTVEPEGF